MCKRLAINDFFLPILNNQFFLQILCIKTVTALTGHVQKM